jgi:aminoglycoside 6-adenylyltransferase
MHADYENAIIRKLIALGESCDLIRAMVLTSSLCNPNAPVDILSDFDIQIFFDDPLPFVESEEWIATIGPVMALWRDEWTDEQGHRWMRMVYYQDGTKMDIQLGYVDDLRRISGADKLYPGYDIGYKVILDKDGVTQSLKKPTYTAYILSPPAEAHYVARIEEFWMDSTYVAKYLWRNDIVAAKLRLNDLADHNLREILEWSVALAKGWAWKPGCLGRGLDKALNPDTRAQLIATYAGGEMDDLWESLFRTTTLYRETAIRVGEGLGYTYPHDLDTRVTIFNQTIRNLNRETASREELAGLLAEGYRTWIHFRENQP